MLPVIGVLRPWADPALLALGRLPMHVSLPPPPDARKTLDGNWAFELFDTLLLDSPGAHHLSFHLQRLAASSEYFGFKCDVASIAAEVAGLPLPGQPQRLRISLERRGRHRVETVPLDDALSWLARRAPGQGRRAAGPGSRGAA